MAAAPAPLVGERVRFYAYRMDRDDAFTAFVRSAMTESVGATVIYRALTQALRNAIDQGC